jgi:choline dehydrogenase-like flavoprotein
MEAGGSYDVIIIGTGGGGGTLLHALAPTGKKILVLERGGYLPREKDNWSSRAVFVRNKYKAHETWYDREGKPFNPEIHYYVGGQTKLYGSALLRFDPKDFGELEHYDGISPAWPISYDVMAPYYAAAERLYHVHSDSGPYPAVRHEPRIQELHDDLIRLGYSPYSLPLGLLLDQHHPDRSPCIRCDTCDGYPCLIKGKADTEVVCVQPALMHKNVTLMTGALVKRLKSRGREVTSVVAELDGDAIEFRGGLVVVSCGAINSAALLLRSASEYHPNGLGNSSGMLGRNYMCHNNSAFVALSPRLNPTSFEKTLALNDFYLGAEDSKLPLGAIQTMGKSDAEKFEAASPVPLPRTLLDQLAKHALDFWVTSEDLPHPDNRVMVGKDGAIGIQYRQNNLEAHDRLNHKLSSLLRQLSPATLCMRKKIPIRGVTHQCGTIRFGHDPKTSVLDVNCKAHDLDNLYVVDGSFMPSSAAMNPALTIFANALRVGDHLKRVLH